MADRDTMSKHERKARAILTALGDRKLIEMLKSTTGKREPHVLYMRLWLVEEIGRRSPRAVKKWLDSDCLNYDDLAKFFLA